MTAVDRRRYRARRTARRLLSSLGDEFRDARFQAGLSQRSVAEAAALSRAEVSRIERGVAPWVKVETLCSVGAAVGLVPSVRCYPVGAPIRDRAHLALLTRLRHELPSTVRWLSEVPLAGPGDLRAWDAVIQGAGWRLAVEAETRIHDVQALERRLGLKRRDGGSPDVLLLINETRHNRLALQTALPSLLDLLPLDTRRMLAALRAGRSPGGSGIVRL